MSSYDAIVIGAGHNGLTAAAYLGRAGRRVLVLEQRSSLGGLAGAIPFHPGYTAPGLLHDATRVRPRVVKDLNLAAYGLQVREEAPSIFVPQTDGPGIQLTPAGIPASDKEAWAEYCGFFQRISALFAHVMDTDLPPVTAEGFGALWEVLKLGLRLRRLGRKDMEEILRIPTMPVADWLGERFQSEPLKAALAAPALFASRTGPRSPGTTATLLIHESLRGAGIVGGPAAFVDALRQACEAQGVTLQTDATVQQIRVDGGRACGVVLSDGTAIDSRAVISSCDPKRTLLSLLASDRVPSELTHDIRQFRMRGTTAKVHLALSGPLEWAHRPGERFEAIRVAEHLDDLERAYDPSKYRQMSERPHLDIRVPTVSQKGLAPDGHEVVSILVHFTPYALEAGWSETTRDRLKEAVLDRLSTVAPAVRDRLVACQVISPELIEQTYGLTEGHVYHGEHALDQLLSLRPVASCGGHSTPIPGLWLCGSGTHPGGGVTGGPGRLAALDVLAA